MKRLSHIVLLFLLMIPSAMQAQLRFTENKGQWPDSILASANIAGGKVLVLKQALVFVLRDPGFAERWHENRLDTGTIRYHAFRLSFLNSQPADIRFSDPWPEYYNYIIGNDPARWKGHVKAYAGLTLTQLYPGVNLELGSGSGGLKFNLVAEAGADLSRIAWAYEGLNSVRLNNGKLQLGTRFGDLEENLPAVYAMNGDAQEPIPAAYILNGNRVNLNLNRRYRKPVVIDPVLVFSTYSGSQADNFGCTGTYDDLGNGYAGGTVFDAGFPTTLGSYDRTFNGGDVEGPTGYGDERDAGILKFSSNGRNLIWATYLGGRSNEQPHSCVVNSRGELVILGSTKSPNFPISATAYDRTYNGSYDIFVSTLSSDGSALVSSTYVGGSYYDGILGDRSFMNANDITLLYNYADEFRGEVIVDSSDDVYVASMTRSIDFPQEKAIQNYGGNVDAVAFKLTRDLSTLEWSTYSGGTQMDAAYGIALGRNKDVYICGGTASQNFLRSMFGLNSDNLGGEADGFILRLHKSDGTFLNSTFIGTQDYDQCHFVQTDNSGRPYVYGQTEGQFPVNGNVYTNAAGGQFIARLNTDLSAITLSTVFGSGSFRPNLSPSAFLVDRCERIFVSGWGGQTNSHIPKNHRNRGNTSGMPITADAQQRNTDGSDFYIAVFSKNLAELLYGTYFGGISSGFDRAEEHVDGGTSRFDKKGIIYQAVCAGCGVNGLFPTTPLAWSRTNQSNNCNNALFKIDFQNLNRKPVVKDTFIQVTATETIDFTFTAYDKDRQDSVFLEFTGDGLPGGKAKAPFASITGGRGLGGATARIVWNTDCVHATGDTFVIRVLSRDEGCPKRDSAFATIRILVTQPPASTPPSEICVNFNDVDNTVKLEWKPFSTDKYFKKIILFRKDPNNKISRIDSFFDSNGGLSIQKTPTDPTLDNYCFYFLAENICGKLFDNGFRVCTVDESDSPVDTGYVVTATVEQDRFVRVVWLKSTEADFESYIIYKAPYDGKSPFKPVAVIRNINDTFWDDYDVNVDAMSYCYHLVITDRCGHKSKRTNNGCTILLEGNSVPFAFNLWWSVYHVWNGGVKQYELRRAVDTGSLRGITVTAPADLRWYDDKLNYDWGGYYYQTVATENLNSRGFSATSASNTIYLIQPPLLWVPSGFTPNSDGLNDDWNPVPVFVKEYRLQLFTRWGEKVLDTDDKHLNWNTDYLRQMSRESVMAWVAEYIGWDGKTYRQRGTVSMIR